MPINDPARPMLIAATAFLSVIVAAACAQPAAPPEPGADAQTLPPENAPDCPLALELTIIEGSVPREWEEPCELKDATARSIRMGEPVSLRMRFTNVSTRPLKIYRPDTARGSLSVRLIGPDGRAVRYRRPQVGKSFAPLDAITLEPGQVTWLETPLFANFEVGAVHRYLFDQQGQWTIDVLHGKGISAPVNVRSKPVFLTVGPPLDNWTQIWDAGLSGLIDNTEPSYPKREECRAKIRALLPPGVSCFDPWLATPVPPLTALAPKEGQVGPEAEARRLAGAYLQALDDGTVAAFDPLIADDALFNRNKNKAMLLQELRQQVTNFDPAKLVVVVEQSEFKSPDANRVLARVQVLVHDDASGRDARSFYFMGFEPRAGAWKITYLDIQRSAR